MNSKNFLNIANGLFSIAFFMILLFFTKDVGAGMFICAYLLYKVLYIIMMGSIRLTVAKMVSARRFRGFYEQAKSAFRYNLTYSIFVGLLCGICIFFFGDYLAKLVFGNILCGSILSILGIYFALHSVCDCICGYYIGCNNGSLVFIAELVFGILSSALCPVFIKLVSQYGNKVSSLLKNDVMVNCYGVIGASLALCAGAFVMLLVLIFGSRGNLTKGKHNLSEMKYESKKQFMNSFLSVAFSKLKDTAFPYVVLFLLVMVYVRTNFSGDMSMVDIYSTIGSFSSKAFILLYIQSSIYGEFVYYYRTKMKTDFKKDEIKNFTSRVNSLLKSSLILVFPLIFSVLAYAEPIAKTLFASPDEAGKTIVVITSFCMLFSGLDKAFIAILESAGYDMSVTIGKVVSLLATTFYSFFVSSKGITTVQLAYGLLIYYLVLCLVHGLFAFKNMNIRINDIVAKLISVVISTGLMFALDAILNRFLHMNLLILAISYLCGYVIYIIALIAIRGVNQKDIKYLKWTIMYYPMNFIGGLFGVR